MHGIAVQPRAGRHRQVESLPAGRGPVHGLLVLIDRDREFTGRIGRIRNPSGQPDRVDAGRPGLQLAGRGTDHHVVHPDQRGSGTGAEVVRIHLVVVPARRCGELQLVAVGSGEPERGVDVGPVHRRADHRVRLVVGVDDQPDRGARLVPVVGPALERHLVAGGGGRLQAPGRWRTEVDRHVVHPDQRVTGTAADVDRVALVVVGTGARGDAQREAVVAGDVPGGVDVRPGHVGGHHGQRLVVLIHQHPDRGGGLVRVVGPALEVHQVAGGGHRLQAADRRMAGQHGAVWVAVLLSVALVLLQVAPYCTQGGVQDTTRHSTGPVLEYGIWVLHWP